MNRANAQGYDQDPLQVASLDSLKRVEQDQHVKMKLPRIIYEDAEDNGAMLANDDENYQFVGVIEDMGALAAASQISQASKVVGNTAKVNPLLIPV